MIKSDVHVRFDILKTIYELTKSNKKRYQSIFPAQIDNCTIQDMSFHLRTLKNKKYLNYQPRMLMRTYQIEILPEGTAIVEDFIAAYRSKEEDRDALMNATLEKLK
ncbi:MAG: hypothetical protein VB095_08865 [Anaerovorax sp.]|nr:hypothetical protein [Anaerovorax sp.]